MDKRLGVLWRDFLPVLHGKVIWCAVPPVCTHIQAWGSRWDYVFFFSNRQCIYSVCSGMDYAPGSWCEEYTVALWALRTRWWNRAQIPELTKMTEVGWWWSHASAWHRLPTHFRSISIYLQYYVWVSCIFVGLPNFAGPISKQRTWLRTMTLRSCASLICSRAHLRRALALYWVHK